MAATPEKWEVDDDKFWDETGKTIANRNLWVSIPNLLCGFAVWLYWGMIIVRMQAIHDVHPELFAFTFGSEDGKALVGGAYKAVLYTLPAVGGLSGATLRIPNSFMISIVGGRNVKFLTSLMLILPSLGAGIALQNPDTPFTTFIILATLSGVGGGAFASSMSNISFFFPKKMQGLSLGLNAGLGNLGVSVMQFLIPWVITFPMMGPGHELKGKTVYLQNAGLVWVPILAFLAVAAWVFMNNLPQHKAGTTVQAFIKYFWLEGIGFVGAAFGVFLLITPWGPVPQLLKIFVVLAITVVVTLALMKYLTVAEVKKGLDDQFVIFRKKHNWVMTWLYTMTFGSFIGYAASFPKLIKDIFGYIRVDHDGNPLKIVLEAGQSLDYATASGATVHLTNATEKVMTITEITNPNAIDAFKFAFLGAMVGALIRPVGGWLSDKLGGARVTQWDTWAMVASTIGAGYVVSQANASPTPEKFFGMFLGLFLVLFTTTGIGNGSTFRMIPIIFEKKLAGPVLGWTSAIAAYGAFFIPKIFATQIKAGTPEYALYGFAAYYASCLAVNWWFYARKGAEIPC
jgi:NNP family nitrate/nitrite transporter-like MFS transporter